jgi:hypothetical protein
MVSPHDDRLVVVTYSKLDIPGCKLAAALNADILRLFLTGGCSRRGGGLLKMTLSPCSVTSESSRIMETGGDGGGGESGMEVPFFLVAFSVAVIGVEVSPWNCDSMN